MYNNQTEKKHRPEKINEGICELEDKKSIIRLIEKNEIKIK